jgi:hypothetical protein
MARKIAVEIVGDSRSLERAFKRSADGAGKFDRQISKTGRGRKAFTGLTKGAGLLTGALGVGGLTTAVKASFDEMQQGQKVAAQTAAVLKSTRGAANVTAGDVDKLATALMNKSGVDDEAIKSGENLLLTFTNIRNGVGKGNRIFDQATGTILDMSTALGQDTKSSAIQLGKALNNPIKGITALQRVGVSFTDGQKKQIKAMVDSGNTMGAQKVILKELNKEFGGSAAAAGKTLPGQLNKLKQSALNLGGAVAQSLTPMITDATKKMVAWLQNGDNQKKVMDTIKGAAVTLGAAVRFLRGAFRGLSRAVGGNRNAVILLVGAYASFKAVQIAGRVATLAGSLRGLRRSTVRATGATRGLRGAAGGLRGSLVGKAGVAGAVALASYELSKLFRKIPNWDRLAKELGGNLYDLAVNLGLATDAMAKFDGKAAPSQAAGVQIRNQARRLEAGGLTPRQAANRLAGQHPGVARRDIDALAGVRGRRPTYNINNLVVNAGNAKQLEGELTRRSKRRQHKRHGT